MSGKILVYIDQFNGAALPASWEVLSAAYTLAEKLGSSVATLTIGKNAKVVAEQSFQYGPEEVFYADDASLADYRAEPYTDVIVRAAKDQNATALLFPTTSRGRELAAMVAVDLKTGVMPDAIALEVKDGTVVVTRPVYAGKLLTKAMSSAKPALITVRVRAFAAPETDASRATRSSSRSTPDGPPSRGCTTSTCSKSRPSARRS